MLGNIATGAPKAAAGFLEITDKPGQGIEPAWDVLGEPIFVAKRGLGYKSGQFYLLLTIIYQRLVYHPRQRLKINEQLVPPNPKLLLIAISSSTSFLVSVTIGKPCARSSRFSILAEAAIKPDSIINIA